MRIVERLRQRLTTTGDEDTTAPEPPLTQRLASLESDFEQIVRDVAAVSLANRRTPAANKSNEPT